MEDVTIENYLTTVGYKLWKSEDTGNFRKKFFQIRLDNKPGWDNNTPLCNSNEKLFLNVDSVAYSANNLNNLSFEVSIVAENRREDWCDLKIYSLTGDKILANLHTYEDQLIRMWKEFNN